MKVNTKSDIVVTECINTYWLIIQYATVQAVPPLLIQVFTKNASKCTHACAFGAFLHIIAQKRAEKQQKISFRKKNFLNNLFLFIFLLVMPEYEGLKKIHVWEYPEVGEKQKA